MAVAIGQLRAAACTEAHARAKRTAPPAQSRMRGCCCEACLAAPRLLRAPKAQGYYGLWQAAAGAGGADVDADAGARARLDAPGRERAVSAAT